MKKIVVLTGSGISAESGISTFRDAGGLWDGYDVMEVASIDGWYKDPAKVLKFYNERRYIAFSAKPNMAHLALKKLESKFEVTIITQNVDDLHERAGSSKIIHLHGELKKAKSSIDNSLVYDLSPPYNINIGDKCEKGSQLRPAIVWFGEAVPMIEIAAQKCMEAEIFIIIGTSLVVYPAAGLINYVPPKVKTYIVDPIKPEVSISKRKIEFITEKASLGTSKLVDKLIG